MFPNNWVFFGVLHFIAIASILAIPLIRFPMASAVVGSTLIIIYLLDFIPKRWPFNYLNHLLPDYTTDFVPLLPWLGVILLGITLGHSKVFNKQFIKATKLTTKLAMPGKHSLVIYLIHQPVMFAVLTPIHWLLK